MSKHHILKPFLASVCLLLALGANAQLRWGPALGVTLSNLSFKQDLIQVDKTVGGSAGMTGEMMFPGIGFGLGLGLYYEQLGAKLHLGDREIWRSLGYGTERSLLHNINIPFHLRFKPAHLGGLEDKFAPIVYGGPTFNITFAHSTVKALKYSGGDVGMTLGAGFELFRRWQVTVSYTWGLSYLEKTKLLSDFSAKNRNWDFRLTYFLK